MLVHRVATPVLERLREAPIPARVLGAGRSAAYIGAGGFVVAVTARGVPLMPNGVALRERPRPSDWPAAGIAAVLRPGLIEAGRWRVGWNAAAPPAWEPAPRAAPSAAGTKIAVRGRALLAALGLDVVESGATPAGLADRLAQACFAGLDLARDAGAREGFELLLIATAERDPLRARHATEALLGRGPGLTPEGDDMLAGAGAAVAVLGPGAGFDGVARERWLAALRPPPGRLTTPLSMTLLRLACGGRVVEPAGALLDLTAGGERRWRAALRRLLAIGHSTGPAYAAAIAATAVLMPAQAMAARYQDAIEETRRLHR